MKRQEEEMLELQSIPLRNYLMKTVMPTLTQGLLECVKVRPDDPVDFVVRNFDRSWLCVICLDLNKIKELLNAVYILFIFGISEQRVINLIFNSMFNQRGP